MFKWVDPQKRKFLAVLLGVLLIEFIAMYLVCRDEHARFEPVRRGMVKTYKESDLLRADALEQDAVALGRHWLVNLGQAEQVVTLNGLI